MRKKETDESAVHKNVVRIPIAEVQKFLKGTHRPMGDDTYIYVFGRQLLRKDFPSGALMEIDDKKKEYIIRPA